MGLRDDMAQEFAAINDTNEFAEDATLKPVSGGEFTVRIIVSQATENVLNQELMEATIEEINVRVPKDPDALGWSRPEIGSSLFREGDQKNDPPYLMQYIQSSNHHSWLIRFQRRRENRVGQAQTLRR